MGGPLSGVKILDLSQVISGPMAATWLADQGGAVIKVEDPKNGDLARWLGPRKGDLGAMFLTANRGKESIVLDLKDSAEDRDLLWRLIDEADVFLQNFRPGAVEKLGFSADAVLARNPRMIYCSLTGYGPTGPYARGRVYDPIIQAAAGYCASQADPATGEPRLIHTLICDKVTALTAAQAITAALFARERSGKGQHVEIAMLDAALAFLWPEGMYNDTFLDDPPDRQPEFGSFYRLWRSKDGHMVIAGVQDAEFRAICRAVDRPDLADDPRFSTIAARMQNAHLFTAELGGAMAQKETAALFARMLEEDAPAGRVNARADLPRDAQIAANGALVEIDHGPEGRVRQPRHPARFSATPCAPPGRAPHLGEHGDLIRTQRKGKFA
jgi:crotonobetainyl-CoA:carnitine CoA-transferase CaiB-like acyl-CoA transferase